jgi:glycosyltransferase involved in cell wall biosynthesis
LGDAALYYKAGDGKALSSELSSVLARTDAERAFSGSAAAARAADFSWDKTAAATIEVLKKAVSERSY